VILFRSSQKLFSNSPAGGAPPLAPARTIKREIEARSIGKFKVSGTHVEPTLAGAAAFDHIPRSNGKPAGQTICD
jgi:hypothetical protein